MNPLRPVCSSTLLLFVFALGAVACSSPNPLDIVASRAIDAGGSQPSSDNGGGDNGPDAPRSPPPTHNPVPVSMEDSGTVSFSGDAGSLPVVPSDASAPGDAAAPRDASAPADAGQTSPLLQHCVNDINAYRSQLGVPALARSSALEAYAAAAASSDGQSGQTHGYYDGNGGSGVSSGEAELPAWPLGQYASMSDLIDQGIAAIGNEGPGASPYDDMTSTQFTQVGCGTSLTPDQNVWVAIDFH